MTPTVSKLHEYGRTRTQKRYMVIARESFGRPKGDPYVLYTDHPHAALYDIEHYSTHYALGCYDLTEPSQTDAPTWQLPDQDPPGEPDPESYFEEERQ